MKLKGSDRIITTDDIEINAGKYIGQNVTDVIESQAKSIEKLQSNIKWIYKYGGVGSGTGGNGGSSDSFGLYATFNGTLIYNNNNIILGQEGIYTLYVTVNKPNNGTYNLSWKCGASEKKAIILSINNDVPYTYEYSIYVEKNTSISVTLTDGDTIIQQLANLITTAYVFGLTLIKDDETVYDVEDNDIFIDTAHESGLSVALNYEIGIEATTEYEYQFNNGAKVSGTIAKTNGLVSFPFEKDFLVNANAGYYTSSVTVRIQPKDQMVTTLKYTIGFSLIPSVMYLKCSPSDGIIYAGSSTKPNILDISCDKNGNLTEITEDIDFYTYNPGYIGFNLKMYQGANNDRTYDMLYQHFYFHWNTALNAGEGGYEALDRLSTTKMVTLKERVLESIYDLYFSDTDPGWHYLRFSVSGQEWYYWLYIKKSESELTFYPNDNYVLTGNYYRSNGSTPAFGQYITDSIFNMTANNARKKIGGNFELPTGTDATSDLNIALGIQYSEINDTKLPILEITLTGGNKSLTIYLDKIVYGDYSMPIYLTKSSNYNLANYNGYHLLNVYFRYVTENTKTNTVYYELVIYLDGILEGAQSTLLTFSMTPYEVYACPGNYYINLLEISNITKRMVKDVDVTRYWYRYNELSLNKVLKIGSGEDAVVTEFGAKVALSKLLASKDKIYYNDEGLVMCDGETANNIAKQISVPTLIIKKTDKGSEDTLSWLHGSYSENEANKTKVQVTIAWSKGLDDPKDSLTTKTGCHWELSLLGSSSMEYRCKNFTLAIEPDTKAQNDDDEIPVFSPNFDSTNKYSFLPEQSFTLKADVVDSSHSNNTTMGEFINKNTTPFDTKQTGTFKGHIKNCLMGFPCIVFLALTTGDRTVYYMLGIYNFNLGRDSYFNMGYRDVSKLNNITGTGDFGIYTIKNSDLSILEGFIVAEISGGNKLYDFSQYQESVLFSFNSSDQKYMFGDEKYGNSTYYKSNIILFVSLIARAGGYLFDCIGKHYSSDAADLYGYKIGYQREYLDGANATATGGYNVISANQVPNYRFLLTRNEVSNEYSCSLQTTQATAMEFKKAVYQDLESTPNTNPAVDYRSLSEYYTICMIFGLVDSVLKNLNIKTWTANSTPRETPATFYIAFYDMDTCLGIDNAGLDVTYFAFSDYWKSGYIVNSNGTISPTKVDIYPDFYPGREGTKLNFVPIGYDIPSSYLFAIAKYAACERFDTGIGEAGESKFSTDFPLYLWALWRRSNGELRNADYFIDKYYAGHLSNIDEPLFNFNYRYKYFQGLFADKNGDIVNNPAYNNKNFEKFNGRRIGKVRDWLNNRFHLLDVYFNLNGSNMYILTCDSQGEWNPVYYNNEPITLPIANPDQNNDDIIVLRDIFSQTSAGVLYNLQIDALVTIANFTPLIISTPTDTYRYLLDDATATYRVQALLTGNQSTRFGGSGMWTSLDSINSFVTDQFYMSSQYIEELNGTAGIVSSWAINMPSLKKVNLSSSNYSGILNLDGGSTSSVKYSNLSEVKLDGTNMGLIINLSAVSKVSVVGGTREKVSLTGCNNLKQLKLVDTTVNILEISPLFTSAFTHNGATRSSDIAYTSDSFVGNVTGGCKFTSITLTGKAINKGQTNNNTLTITNDNALTNITFSNFSKVTITNCPNLRSINIGDVDQLTELKIINCGTSDTFTVSMLSDTDITEGTIDLWKQTKLSTLYIYGCTTFTTINLAPGIVLGDNALANNYNLSTVNVIKRQTTTNGTTEYVYGSKDNAGDKIIINGSSIFSGTSVTLKMTNNDWTPLIVSSSLTSISSMFYSYYGTTKGITLESAKYFIKECIPADNAITNVSYLFSHLYNLSYPISLGIEEYSHCSFWAEDNEPNVSAFKNLIHVTDADSMFAYTSVYFCNRYMFRHNDGWQDTQCGPDTAPNSSNYGLGARSSSLNIYYIIWSTGASTYDGYANAIGMTTDYYHDILSRMTYNSLGTAASYTAPLYYMFTSGSNPVKANNIVLKDMFYKVVDSNIYKPINITHISNFNFVGDTTVDFGSSTATSADAVFSTNVFPNLTTFNYVFYKNNLNFVNFDYAFYQLVNAEYQFIDSFNSSNASMQLVNFGTLFNWSNVCANTHVLIAGKHTYGKDPLNIASVDTYYSSFNFAKYIEWNDFKKIISLILNSPTLTSISHFFNNCILYAPIGYDGSKYHYSIAKNIQLKTLYDNANKEENELGYDNIGLQYFKYDFSLNDLDGYTSASTPLLTYPINNNIKEAAYAFYNFKIISRISGQRTAGENETDDPIFIPIADDMLACLPKLTHIPYMFANVRFGKCIPLNFFLKRYYSTLKTVYGPYYYEHEITDDDNNVIGTEILEDNTKYRVGILYNYDYPVSNKYNLPLQDIRCVFHNCIYYASPATRGIDESNPEQFKNRKKCTIDNDNNIIVYDDELCATYGSDATFFTPRYESLSTDSTWCNTECTQNVKSAQYTINSYKEYNPYTNQGSQRNDNDTATVRLDQLKYWNRNKMYLDADGYAIDHIYWYAYKQIETSATNFDTPKESEVNNNNDGDIIVKTGTFTDINSRNGAEYYLSAPNRCNYDTFDNYEGTYKNRGDQSNYNKRYEYQYAFTVYFTDSTKTTLSLEPTEYYNYVTPESETPVWINLYKTSNKPIVQYVGTKTPYNTNILNSNLSVYLKDFTTIVTDTDYNEYITNVAIVENCNTQIAEKETIKNSKELEKTEKEAQRTTNNGLIGEYDVSIAHITAINEGASDDLNYPDEYRTDEEKTNYRTLLINQYTEERTNLVNSNSTLTSQINDLDTDISDLSDEISTLLTTKSSAQSDIDDNGIVYKYTAALRTDKGTLPIDHKTGRSYVYEFTTSETASMPKYTVNDVGLQDIVIANSTHTIQGITESDDDGHSYNVLYSYGDYMSSVNANGGTIYNIPMPTYMMQVGSNLVDYTDTFISNKLMFAPDIFYATLSGSTICYQFFAQDGINPIKNTNHYSIQSISDAYNDKINNTLCGIIPPHLFKNHLNDENMILYRMFYNHRIIPQYVSTKIINEPTILDIAYRQYESIYTFIPENATASKYLLEAFKFFFIVPLSKSPSAEAVKLTIQSIWYGPIEFDDHTCMYTKTYYVSLASSFTPNLLSINNGFPSYGPVLNVNVSYGSGGNADWYWYNSSKNNVRLGLMYNDHKLNTTSQTGISINDRNQAGFNMEIFTSANIGQLITYYLARWMYGHIFNKSYYLNSRSSGESDYVIYINPEQISRNIILPQGINGKINKMFIYGPSDYTHIYASTQIYNGSSTGCYRAWYDSCDKRINAGSGIYIETGTNNN